MAVRKEYKVCDTNNVFVRKVKAVSVVEAAEKANLRPCHLMADHLPYSFVLVEEDGTLDFSEGKVPMKEQEDRW